MSVFRFWGVSFVFLCLGVTFFVWSFYGDEAGLQFNLLGFCWPFLDFQLSVDFLSKCCWCMLFFCGATALVFNTHYFGQTSVGNVLSLLLIVFLGVMCSLVLSGSWTVTLILWEYLGIVSVGLILFRLSSGSLRAALITLASSRFGDVSLFFLIGWVHWYFDFEFNVSSFMLLLVVVTKSACYPLISWLLEAMRAPTPVSSLVHSSTLVAAGAWFLYRYSFVFGPHCVMLLFSLCVVTVILTGLFALVHSDLKKLVALSTCNNVSWCVIFFLYCGLDLAIAQLVVHGLCKCYLFMSVGDVMLSSGSSQSSKNIFSSRYLGGRRLIIVCVLVLSLCGLPFLGVFFNKHCFFSALLGACALGDLFCLFFGLFLSFCYSFRLLLLLLSGLGVISSSRPKDFVLVGYFCLIGTFIGYLFCGYMVDDNETSMLWSIISLLVQFLGGVSGCFLFWVSGVVGVPRGVASLYYSDRMIGWLYSSVTSLTSSARFLVLRWEGVILSSLLDAFKKMRFLGNFFFSFNLVVVGVVLMLITWVVIVG